MQKFFFFILILFCLSFSISSCQSVRQIEISSNASNAAAQNSKKEPQQKAEAIQVTPKEENPGEQNKSATDSAPQTSASGEKFENRCGWFSNPTPANASLEDKDGEWIIGVQGGYQAEGDYPDFDDDKWVKTNVNYGYGCACLKVTVDYKTHRILKIAGATAKPLATCRQDPALKEPN
ncbi:MAG TPA: DUF4087 domain-containing protein [Pyrinomonadaceae bacterium]|jgi:hypothetical protein